MTLDSTSAAAVNSTAPLGCSGSQIIHCLSFASLSQLLTSRLGLIAGFVIILVVKYVSSPWRSVPLGPKGLPMLGNALQLQDKRWMFDKACKLGFGALESVFVDSAVSSLSDLWPRTYDVPECPWPANHRH